MSFYFTRGLEVSLMCWEHKGVSPRGRFQSLLVCLLSSLEISIRLTRETMTHFRLQKLQRRFSVLDPEPRPASGSQQQANPTPARGGGRRATPLARG